MLQQEAYDKVLQLYQDYPIKPYISPKRDLIAWLNDVQIGKEKLVPKRNLVLLDDHLTAGDIILLWRVHFGTFTTESWYPKYFEYTYGIDGLSRMRELIKKGYVHQESALESLNHVTMPFLKTLLKEKEIKGLSKMKREMVDAEIRKLFTEEELSECFSVRGYRLTHLGEAVLAAHPEVIDRHPQKKF